MSKRLLLLVFLVLSLTLRLNAGYMSCVVTNNQSTAQKYSFRIYDSQNVSSNWSGQLAPGASRTVGPYLYTSSYPINPFKWFIVDFLNVSGPSSNSTDLNSTALSRIDLEVQNTWPVDGPAPSPTPIPTPTPSPTATPVPSPTPDPADDPDALMMQGNIGDLPKGMTARYKVTLFDGREFYADVDAEGNWGLYLPGDAAGMSWTGSATFFDTIEAGGVPVAVYIGNEQSGNLPGYVPDTTVNVPVPNISAVNSSGSSVPDAVVRETVGQVISSNGTATPINQYIGGTTGKVTASVNAAGVAYSVQGAATGTGAGGSFVAAPGADPVGVDLTDVKNLLREANLQRKIYGDAVVSQLSGISAKLSATPSPSPSPGSTPAPPTLDSLGIPNPDAETFKSGLRAAIGAAPSTGSIARGGATSFWHLRGFDRWDLDFDPLSDIRVVAVGNWVYTILTLLVTGILLWATLDVAFLTLTEMYKIPQADPPDVIVGGGGGGQVLGNGGTAMFVANAGIALGPVIAILILTLTGAAWVVFSTATGIRVDFSSTASQTFITSVSTALSNTSGPLGAAWTLSTFFIPYDHFLTSFGFYLWVLFMRIPIYTGLAVIKTMIFA